MGMMNRFISLFSMGSIAQVSISAYFANSFSILSPAHSKFLDFFVYLFSDLGTRHSLRNQNKKHGARSISVKCRSATLRVGCAGARSFAWQTEALLYYLIGMRGCNRPERRVFLSAPDLRFSIIERNAPLSAYALHLKLRHFLHQSVDSGLVLFADLINAYNRAVDMIRVGGYFIDLLVSASGQPFQTGALG